MKDEFEIGVHIGGEDYSVLIDGEGSVLSVQNELGQELKVPTNHLALIEKKAYEAARELLEQRFDGYGF